MAESPQRTHKSSTHTKTVAADRRKQESQIYNLHAKGYTVNRLTALFNLSAKRIYQILAKMRRQAAILSEAHQREAREILVARSEERINTLADIVYADPPASRRQRLFYNRERIAALAAMLREDGHIARLLGANADPALELQEGAGETPEEKLRLLLEFVTDKELRKKIKQDYDDKLRKAGVTVPPALNQASTTTTIPDAEIETPPEPQFREPYPFERFNAANLEIKPTAEKKEDGEDPDDMRFFPVEDEP